MASPRLEVCGLILRSFGFCSSFFPFLSPRRAVRRMPWLMPLVPPTSITSRPSTSVKMEDRKRPAVSTPDDLAPPTKPQAVNGGGKSRDDGGDSKDEAWIEVRVTRPPVAAASPRPCIAMHSAGCSGSGSSLPFSRIQGPTPFVCPMLPGQLAVASCRAPRVSSPHILIDFLPLFTRFHMVIFRKLCL